jgi:hypothetical protein
VPLNDEQFQYDLDKGADDFKFAMLQAMLHEHSKLTPGKGGPAPPLLQHGRRGSTHLASSEDEAPGTLQLLVRWELTREASRILVEPEYTTERSASKLQHALQVVLERGDEKVRRAPAAAPS